MKRTAASAVKAADGSPNKTTRKPRTRIGRSDQKPEIAKPDQSTTLPADADRKTGDEFGIEGTNKTVATPRPGNLPSDELGLGPHVEKTPYTRG